MSGPPKRKSSKKLVPKRHHWYAVLLFIFGCVFPPLAVAARFGVGKDFFINLVLTLCGYIPGHGHNFYVQNIRNNQTKARTPRWAQRYGLVNTEEIERKQRKSQWAARYNERNQDTTLAGQAYEEGQAGGAGPDTYGADVPARRPGEGERDLWRPDEESFYREDDRASTSASSAGGHRWHYPANFDDALPAAAPKKRKKEKKDRHARTEDAYAAGPRRRSSRRTGDAASTRTDSSAGGFPEDAEGGLYGASTPARSNARDTRDDERTPPARGATGDEFSHQF